MSKIFLLLTLCFVMNIKITAQKLKSDIMTIHYEAYPEIILPSEIKSYTVNVQMKSNDKYASFADKEKIRNSIRLKSLEFVENNADLIIEFIYGNETIFPNESGVSMAITKFIPGGKIKIMNREGRILFDGESYLLIDSKLKYERSLSDETHAKNDYLKGLYSYLSILEIGIRSKLEMNIKKENIHFTRIKSDVEYDKLLSRLEKYFKYDTLFAGREKTSDSINNFINIIQAISPIKKDDSELIKRYEYSKNSNLAIINSLLEKCHISDSLIESLEGFNEKERLQDKQKIFLEKRKKNIQNYYSMLSKVESGDYNPFSNTFEKEDGTKTYLTSLILKNGDTIQIQSPDPKSDMREKKFSMPSDKPNIKKFQTIIGIDYVYSNGVLYQNVKPYIESKKLKDPVIMKEYQSKMSFYRVIYKSSILELFISLNGSEFIARNTQDSTVARISLSRNYNPMSMKQIRNEIINAFSACTKFIEMIETEKIELKKANLQSYVLAFWEFEKNCSENDFPSILESYDSPKLKKAFKH